MKFAKELERDLVPEWRIKYLDYKVGKKKLKAIKRALRTINQTPHTRRWGQNTFTPSPYDTAPKYSFLNRNHGRNTSGSRETGPLRGLAISNSQSILQGNSNGNAAQPEEVPLRTQEDRQFPGITRYGSIIGTPPKEGALGERGRAPPSLKLPGAALDADDLSTKTGPSESLPPKSKSITLPPAEGSELDARPTTANAFKTGKTRSPTYSNSLPARYRSVFSPKRVNSTSGVSSSQQHRPLITRVFSMTNRTPLGSPGDVPLEAYRELDMRQAEFFHFLDMELDKIETFYKHKEDEATARLAVLRDQLHMMRDRRLDTLITRQAAKMKAKVRKQGDAGNPLTNGHSDDTRGSEQGPIASWMNPIDSALQAVQAGRYGKSTKAMQDLATPTALEPRRLEEQRDYMRRPEVPDVSYETAKRKLKVALQEFYRGLELLKSYAILNRIAFRKINKKYDKAVNARPSLRYMTEKVNKAWFVNSDVIEGHIRNVEDLYARYFEKGNHKVAINKLRIKTARAGDYTESSFRNGLMLGLGAVFGIQGLIKACQLLASNDITIVTNTSFLLQVYAGYLLINLLFLLFCLDCRVWHENKINYAFVFEYDTRHHLDWRQLSELPCFFLFILGFFVWLNFNQYGAASMFLYYPVILLGIATIMLFIPIRVFYYRSRMWLIYSLWRLICAGLYPVEWRDFYMGDMFCSLTYSMGNIELFFCLYANDWNDPAQCNSSHSRLMGFLATLPGIWRALQCFRRYHDTGNAFPHLLNLGKYTATIVFYMTLSIYRIDKTTATRALFITFATVNSVYTSFWDVYYDWSLGDPNAKYPFLRQTLGYKKVWMYYVAMVIDPILRFNWILYAVIHLQLQHSGITSFFVSFSEVLRRGMWSLFRVENEHCSNVGHFRASRDVPLPYDLPSPEESRSSLGYSDVVDEEQPQHMSRASTAPDQDHQAHASGTDLEQRRSSIRRRRASLGADQIQPSPMARGLQRMGTALRTAHAQDFEKKKKPELGDNISKDDDSDDDEDDDAEEHSGNVSDSESQSLQHGDMHVNNVSEVALGQAREELEIGRAGPSS